MSASHSPVIGDKLHQPIELLINAEQCDFGRGLVICGMASKFCMHLHVIVTNLYIHVARAFPIIKTLPTALNVCHFYIICTSLCRYWQRTHLRMRL